MVLRDTRSMSFEVYIGRVQTVSTQRADASARQQQIAGDR